MKFRYLADPVFLVCFTAYWLNRLAEAWNLSPALLQAYLNDFVCAGFWIPPMLWVSRKLKLRAHDGPPDAIEILVPLVIWTAVFEVVLPTQQRWQGIAIADSMDVVCYFAGGLAASLCWGAYYRPTTTQQILS